MLSKRSGQRGLFETDHLYADLVGRDRFYGQLTGLWGKLLPDEDLAVLYCRDNGRSSVPPSLLAAALLQHAKMRVLFLHILDPAQTQCLLWGRTLQMALHTTSILGRRLRRTPTICWRTASDSCLGRWLRACASCCIRLWPDSREMYALSQGGESRPHCVRT